MLVRFERIPMTSPFETVNELERSIDSLFGNFLSNPSQGTVVPMDLAEYKDESILLAEVPGVRKEDLRISVHDDVITISGKREPAQMTEGTQWLRNEIAAGEFTRSLMLPHQVKAEQIGAELTNGILRVTLPKAEEARPREIPVH